MTVFPLERSEILNRLEREYHLPPETIYLLHLAPLIEILWADGQDQKAERILVHEYAMRLQRAWAHEAGAEVITDQALHHFFTRFLDRDDDRVTLHELTGLLLAQKTSGAGVAALSLDTVLDYCIDIAACAVTHYPYGLHERVNAPEKAILKELVVTIASRRSEQTSSV